MSIIYDVIVLGLGAMGSAAAFHLAQRGKRVLGLERFDAAHTFGSSHGESRIIRLAYHEHVDYVPLLQRSYELWAKLEQDTGASLYERTGGLMIGRAGDSVVEGAIRSAQQHGLAHEVMGAKDLQARFPVLRPRPNEKALYEAVAGYLRPEAAIQAHLELASSRGAELHFHEPVEGWSIRTGERGVAVKTSRGTYRAERLVVAAGAWSPDMLGGSHFPFDVQRRVMCWFQPASDPEYFRLGRLPIYIWAVDSDTAFYGFPGGAPEGVKVAMHNGGESCTADTLDRDIRPNDIEEIRACLRQFVPALNGRFVKALACMYTMTPDEHFVLGLHPDYRNVAVAAGFSGHGFKFSSVIGEILADLSDASNDGRTRFDIQFLSPERFGSPPATAEDRPLL